MSEHAEKILAAARGEDDASALAASWRRCLEVHGVDPDRAIAPEPDPAAWRQARERDAELLEVAREPMDQLYQLLADADCGVFLADRDAVMLDIRTNRTCDTWNRPPEAWLGTTYSEAAAGTNGVGTCLAEQRGVILRGDQHYLTRYASRACIGAPLFGPDGDLLGCLAINQNVDAHDARLDAFLSITVASFARRIETALFARAFPKARLMLAAPAGNPSALLAVDPDDCVVGATRAARRLHALSEGALPATLGLDALLARPSRGGGDLAKLERRAIERALARAGGNLSAAARLVGISRSTLYRKVARYELRGRD